jgi:ubiquinone/menaquinone biosynthesis C-methylase UbiE
MAADRGHRPDFDVSLAALRAIAEPTRLRIVALLQHGECSVTDLCEILGQSQPRISRHLRLLHEAGVITRHREGTWAFHRLANTPALSPLIAAAIPDREDHTLRIDLERLGEVRVRRAAAADDHFAAVAPLWDTERSLLVGDDIIEARLLNTVGEGPFDTVVDVGTGTGRMLELLAQRARRLIGLDANHTMLSVARANLERAGIHHAELHHGDLHNPPVGVDGGDLVIVHQVLHHLDDPDRSLTHIARLVRPGGRLVIVDLAPHSDEKMRTHHAHRRLGFSTEQIDGWLAEAGCTEPTVDTLRPESGTTDRLTVMIWTAERLAEASESRR